MSIVSIMPLIIDLYRFLGNTKNENRFQSIVHKRLEGTFQSVHTISGVDVNYTVSWRELIN